MQIQNLPTTSVRLDSSGIPPGSLSPLCPNVELCRHCRGTKLLVNHGHQHCLTHPSLSSTIFERKDVAEGNVGETEHPIHQGS